MAQLGFELTTSATPPSTALSVTSTDCAIERTYIYIYTVITIFKGLMYNIYTGVFQEVIKTRCSRRCSSIAKQYKVPYRCS